MVQIPEGSNISRSIKYPPRGPVMEDLIISKPENVYLDCLHAGAGGHVFDGGDQAVPTGADRAEQHQVQGGGPPGVVLERQQLGGGRDELVGVRDVHGSAPRVHGRTVHGWITNCTR